MSVTFAQRGRPPPNPQQIQKVCTMYIGAFFYLCINLLEYIRLFVYFIIIYLFFSLFLFLFLDAG